MSTPVALKVGSDIFELRIYEAMPDRLDALHKRMGKDVLPVFVRNGIPRPVANWECRLGPGAAPLYIHLLRWPDMDMRMSAFASFYADSDWQAMYAHGPTITSMDVCFLRPAYAWPDDGGRRLGTLHEMRFHNFTTADSEHANTMLRDVELPHMHTYGAVVLGAFNVILGEVVPVSETGA